MIEKDACALGTSLALFMTTGMSLKRWAELGSLERELALYNRLAVHMTKIYIISYGDDEELQFRPSLAENVEIMYNPWKIGDALYSILCPIFHREAIANSDILKTNQMNGSWGAVIAKYLYGKKLIIRQGYPWLRTLNGIKAPYWKRLIATAAEWLAYRAADKIVVTGTGDKEQLDNIFNEKMVILPNYVDTDRFKPFNSKRYRNRLGNRLVYVGRLAKAKNLFNLIDAVKDMDVTLSLIGQGEQEQDLRDKVREEHINNVMFMGKIDNSHLPFELNNASIYVQVSLEGSEGNPKTILEAMSCGLIVIGSDVAGINDIIKHGENGYLCGTDVESIKQAIGFVISSPDNDRIARNARNTILETNSLNILEEKERRLYDEVRAWV